MEKDVRDSFERIEKGLNAIEDLGKALKTAIEEISTDLMHADHGVDTKLDRTCNFGCPRNSGPCPVLRRMAVLKPLRGKFRVGGPAA